MELKKNPEADLEKKRGLMFQVGLIAALAIVLVAFEWSVYEGSGVDLGGMEADLEEEEMIPITQQEYIPPPPPPPQPTMIEIVEDDEEIEDEMDIEESDIDEDLSIEIVETVEEPEEEEIFTIVEQMPSFPGGEEALFKYLGKNIKYPPMARDAGISGKVYIEFVCNKKGEILDVKVLRGIGGGCDEEATRVVKNMPNWIAGKQRGKPVPVRYRLPINFILKN